MKRAPVPFLLDCPGASHRLAFGLRWLALIGSDVPALARVRGRRLRATHFIVGGSPATMAGFGRLRSSWRIRGQGERARHDGSPRVQAAAQLYALLYPLGGHCLIDLPGGRYWLAAAQDGVVLSQADRLFNSRDDAAQAQARLREQRPGLVEHDADAVWAALLRAVDPGARMARLPSRWAGVPFALRLFLACVAVSALAPPLWRAVTSYVFSEPRASRAEEALSAGQQNPYQSMISAMAAHGPLEVSRLLRSVGELPVQVQGWALRRAQCDAQASGWSCAAVYVRAHPQATNRRLHARLPAGWRVSFKPLDEATLAWHIASPPVPLARLMLPSALHVDTELVAILQRLRPAFSSMTLAPAIVLPLPAPMSAPMPDAVGADTANVALTDPLPVLRRRALRLQGPLRSLALLPAAIAPARWSRLVVDVQPQHRPTLVASTLVAELQGDLYEQD